MTLEEDIVRFFDGHSHATFSLPDLVHALEAEDRTPDVKAALFRLVREGTVLKLWPPGLPRGVPLKGPHHGHYQFQLKTVVNERKLWPWVVR